MPGDATESREPLVELAEAVEAIVTECEKVQLLPLGQQEMGTLRDAGAALRAAARPSRSVRSLTIPLPDAPDEHWVYMQAGWPLTGRAVGGHAAHARQDEARLDGGGGVSWLRAWLPRTRVGRIAAKRGRTTTSVRAR